MESQIPYKDPGWRGAFQASSRRSGGSTPFDAVLRLRLPFAWLLVAPFVVLVALFFTVDGVLGKVDVSLAAGAAAIALGGVFVGRAVRGWPLDNSTPQRVGESYQSRLWNAYAAIQLPLLLCFMASLLRDELWPYLTVLPIHLVGLASIAPGLADIARRQEELRRAGSTVSLADALQFPPWRSPSP